MNPVIRDSDDMEHVLSVTRDDSCLISGFRRKVLKNEFLPGCGPGSVVGTATVQGLDGTEIESRWGRDFSAPVQTGPGAHPASRTMGTGSFSGVKSGRGVTLNPHHL